MSNLIKLFKENQKLGTLKTTILLTISFFFCIFAFERRSHFLFLHSPQRVNVLDVHFGYGYSTVKSFFQELGAEGRHYYAETQLTLDLIFPIIYSLLLLSLVLALCRCSFRLGNSQTWKKKFTFVIYGSTGMIILGTASDYIENLLLASLARNYPSLSFNIIQVASVFTSIKFSTLGLVVINILLITLFRLMQCLNNDKGGKSTYIEELTGIRATNYSLTAHARKMVNDFIANYFIYVLLSLICGVLMVLLPFLTLFDAFGLGAVIKNLYLVDSNGEFSMVMISATFVALGISFINERMLEKATTKEDDSLSSKIDISKLNIPFYVNIFERYSIAAFLSLPTWLALIIFSCQDVGLSSLARGSEHPFQNAWIGLSLGVLCSYLLAHIFYSIVNKGRQRT